ncbi:Transmembrane protein [Melia azedarach]|uniref:Transmembrane protein n=2 Tax=Melia azedarach TaxID=155640 RepID=A0ACC1YJU8_MELAZ|nr:Transmembrane protein [Melia azedarach]KAJ4723639.1 Transmembrane protein [Melia azedarach]
MNSRNVSTVLIILVISLAVLSHVGVEATRVMPEDFAKANHLETYSSPPSVYEQAKFTMSFWLQRLASGPSPKGPGH